jgi:hypothetical protein
MTDKDLEVESPHRLPKFGIKNMDFLVEHFISGHAEVHFKQMERALRQYNEAH